MLYLRTLIFSAVSLVVLFLFTKLIGKRQMANMSLFDYINGMTIGSIAGEMATGIEDNIWVGIIAMSFYGVSVFVIDVIDRKYIRARRFFSGTPTTLYKNGKFLKENFKKAQVSISEFQEMCRVAGYYDISCIAQAQLEQSGRLSILVKTEEEPLTLKSFREMPKKAAFAPVSVIYDGVVLDDNLKSVGRDDRWLHKELKTQHTKLSEVFLATVDGEGALTCFLSSDHLR
ncbi:MAG: DUF421 domain-containing protein [Clostridia bacterium]|nr:DUF421 domain-containing protein [Clostridia bacterium]